MRLLAIITGLLAVAGAFAQTYTQVFDIPDPVANFQKVAVDGSRNIYLAGNDNGTLIARRLNEDGSEEWTTTISGTSQASVDEITLDADGNIYLAARVGPNGSKICFLASLNRFTGAVRWTKQITTVDDSSPASITTAKVGNSTLVYAATTLKVSATNFDALALRLSPTTGADVWRVQINLGGGVTKDFSQRITANGNGAPIMLARRDVSQGVLASIFRLSGTDGSTVFRRDFPGLSCRPDGMQVLTGNNNIGVSGINSDLIRPTTLALVNGTNGAIIASEDLPGFARGARSTKFGAYLAPRQGGGDLFMAKMDGITGRFAQTRIDFGPETVLAIDGADQIHYSVLLLQSPGHVAREPAGLSQEFPFMPTAGVVDNKQNLIVVGRADGVNHVGKFSQVLAVNSDLVNAPFGTTLSVSAPGFLANDFAAGAEITLASSTNNGSLTFFANGAFTYTPNNANVNSDVFVYRAELNGESKTASVIINRNFFEAMTSFKSTVIGSEPVTVFAKFKFAPSFAGALNLTDNSPLIATPPVISINTLSDQTGIVVTTSIVTSNIQTTLTGTAFGTSRSINITLQPGGLGNLSLGGTDSMVAGQTAIGRVELTAPAPSGGREVDLTKVSGNANLPSSVTVPAGSTFAVFTITTPQSTTGSTLEVHAKLFGGVRVAVRQITPMAKVQSIDIPSTIVGGQDFPAIIQLDKKTPYNLSITTSLLDNTAGATAPSSAIAVANQETATLTITIPTVTTAKAFKVRATVGGGTAERQVLVIANPLDRVTAVPTNVTGGQPSQGTVHLNNLAPNGGIKVNLSTSRPGLVTVPASVTVPTSSWSVDFQIQTRAVANTITANVNAKIANVTKTVVLTLNP